MRRWIALVAGALVAGYLLAVALLFVGQRTILFQPPSPARRPSVGQLVDAEAEGRIVLAWVPAREGAPTIVWFHGNAQQIADLDPLLSAFADAGLGAAAVEYPGYGLLAGSPSQDAIFATSDAALRELRRRGVGEVVLAGQSLGTGVAVEMAARGYGSRVVLLSPYTSMTAMARERFPLAPAFLLRDPFDTASRAAAIRVPVLVVHGTEDPLIPFAMGQELAAAFPEATLRPVPGGGHDDLFRRDPGLIPALVAFARGGPE